MANPINPHRPYRKCRDTPGGNPIGINLSLSPGFRRGEGGLVDGLGAFKVARGWGETSHSAVSRYLESSTAGDLKGPPSHASPRSPLRTLMSFSKVDAY